MTHVAVVYFIDHNANALGGTRIATRVEFPYVLLDVTGKLCLFVPASRYAI
jgi:hypothetical protein